MKNIIILIFICMPLWLSGQDNRFLSTNSNCLVYVQGYLSGDFVTWSGKCAKGYAEGYGTRIIYNNGSPRSTYEGNMKLGKREGKGTNYWSDGRKYIGTFKDNNFWNGSLYESGSIEFERYKNGVKIELRVDFKIFYSSYSDTKPNSKVFADIRKVQNEYSADYFLVGKLDTVKNLIYYDNPITLYCINTGLKRIFADVSTIMPTITFNGDFTTYFFNGNISSVSKYTNNFAYGETRRYWSNGNLWCVSNLVDGYAEGDYSVYYENGNISETGNDKHGKRVGYYESWKKNGDYVGRFYRWFTIDSFDIPSFPCKD